MRGLAFFCLVSACAYALIAMGLEIYMGILHDHAGACAFESGRLGIGGDLRAVLSCGAGGDGDARRRETGDCWVAGDGGRYGVVCGGGGEG